MQRTIESSSLSASPGTIRFREGGEKALAHTLAERLGRAFERRDLTEDDPVFGDTFFGERGSASKTKDKRREENQRSIMHSRRSFYCASMAASDVAVA
jgi:hypothetical protein